MKKKNKIKNSNLFNLRNLDLSELESFELQAINGGEIHKGHTLAWAIGSLVALSLIGLGGYHYLYKKWPWNKSLLSDSLHASPTAGGDPTKHLDPYNLANQSNVKSIEREGDAALKPYSYERITSPLKTPLSSSPQQEVYVPESSYRDRNSPPEWAGSFPKLKETSMQRLNALNLFSDNDNVKSLNPLASRNSLSAPCSPYKSVKESVHQECLGHIQDETKDVHSDIITACIDERESQKLIDQANKGKVQDVNFGHPFAGTGTEDRYASPLSNSLLNDSYGKANMSPSEIEVSPFTFSPEKPEKFKPKEAFDESLNKQILFRGQLSAYNQPVLPTIEERYESPKNTSTHNADHEGAFNNIPMAQSQLISQGVFSGSKPVPMHEREDYWQSPGSSSQLIKSLDLPGGEYAYMPDYIVKSSHSEISGKSQSPFGLSPSPVQRRPRKEFSNNKSFLNSQGSVGGDHGGPNDEEPIVFTSILKDPFNPQLPKEDGRQNSLRRSKSIDYTHNDDSFLVFDDPSDDESSRNYQETSFHNAPKASFEITKHASRTTLDAMQANAGPKKLRKLGLTGKTRDYNWDYNEEHGKLRVDLIKYMEKVKKAAIKGVVKAEDLNCCMDLKGNLVSLTFKHKIKAKNDSLTSSIHGSFASKITANRIIKWVNTERNNQASNKKIKMQGLI